MAALRRAVRAVRNEKGSSMIFLLLVLAGMVSLASVYIYGAGLLTDRSYTESVLHLAGRSVLTEYDTALKEEYGIVAYRGSSRDAQEAATMYAAASLESRPVSFTPFPLRTLSDALAILVGEPAKPMFSSATSMSSRPQTVMSFLKASKIPPGVM